MSTHHKHFRRFEYNTFIDPILIIESSFTKTVEKEEKKTNDYVMCIYVNVARSVQGQQ